MPPGEQSLLLQGERYVNESLQGYSKDTDQVPEHSRHRDELRDLAGNLPPTESSLRHVPCVQQLYHWKHKQKYYWEITDKEVEIIM